MLEEAKVTKDKTSMYPAASGEQHFVDKHKIKDVISKYLKPDNGITNASSKVKTYNRSKDRMGNNEVESIKKYDENVYLGDRSKTAHKRKLKLRHILDKGGNVVDTDLNARTNHDAVSKFRKVIGGKHHGLAVVKEVEEFKVGDYVHMGLKTKGGAGFRGHIKSIDEETGEVHLELPKHMHTFFPKIIKGHKSKCFKESVEENVEQLDEKTTPNKAKKNAYYAQKGLENMNMKDDAKKATFIKGLKKGRQLKEGEEPIEELSKKKLVDYLNKSTFQDRKDKDKFRALAYNKIDKKMEFDESENHDEMVTELTRKVLQSYVKKAQQDTRSLVRTSNMAKTHNFTDEKKYADNKLANRLEGINKAKDRMGKPHVGQEFPGARRFTKESEVVEEGNPDNKVKKKRWEVKTGWNTTGLMGSVNGDLQKKAARKETSAYKGTKKYEESVKELADKYVK